MKLFIQILISRNSVMSVADERNFRSSYYEKVGFRSVEEKKSLEILLKDKPLDKGKLMQFCLRFTLPGIYRNLLWKLLLGVLPVHIDSHKFVYEQRQQQYNDLLEALKVMKLADVKSTSKSQIFLFMWLLECGDLKINWTLQLEHPRYIYMSRIPSTLLNIFDDDVDVYWISKGFFKCVEKFHTEMPKLSDCTKSYLEKEDQELYNHLINVGALEYLPLDDWFCSCFAGVLHEAALSKIWDKMVGGSCKILVFVALVYLTTMKRPLMTCRSTDDILKCLKNINEEAADMVANKAIELWQQYGSCLTPGSGPEGMKNHPGNVRNKTVT